MSKENQEEKISIFKSFLLKSWDLSKKILDRLLFFGRNDEINSLRNRINKYLNLFHNFRKRYEKYSNLKADSLIYKCNICGNTSVSTFKELHREVPTCTSCGSNVRFRSIVHLLSLEIFDESICLEDFPIRKDISVLGFSDWEGYTDKLAEKLNCLNTYFHKDPRLDISQIDHELEGKFD